MSKCKETCIAFSIHLRLLLLNLKQTEFRVDCLANPCDSSAIEIFFNCTFSVLKYQFILFLTWYFLNWHY